MARDFISACSGELQIGDIDITCCVTTFIWANPDALSGNQNLITKRLDTQSNRATYSMGFVNSKMRFFQNTGGTWRIWGVDETNVFVNGTWENVSVTYDEVVDAKQYDNGVQLTSNDSLGSGIPAIPTNCAVGSIGFSDNNNEAFNGQLAYAVTWQSIIPVAHLLAMSRGANPFLFDSCNMKMYFPIHGNDSPETNYIGQSPTGTVVAAAKDASNPPVEPLENYL